MNRRVYGVIGIGCKMSNWNADFSGYPKMLGSGQIFSSDKALKHAMRRLWEDRGQNVLALRSSVIDKGVLKVRSLDKRYEQLFGKDDFKDMQKTCGNLFTAVDVKQFGVAFAVAKASVAIRGAVQIGQGLNVYPDTEIVEQQILSPYANSKKEDATQGTLGTQIMMDEAHYMFPFVINPQAYESYVQMGVTDGYTEADYENFKLGATQGVSAFASCARSGCENEFALFVEVDEQAYLRDLSDYITFVKGDKHEIHVDVDGLQVAYGNVIQKIEVYYDPQTITLTGCDSGVMVNDIRKQN